MVNFLQFVRPFVRMTMGHERPFLPVVHARLRAPLRRAPGRVELLRVRLEREGAELWATPAGRHQGSGNVGGMAEGHGFALLDATSTEVSGVVRVQVFDREFDDSMSAAYSWGGLHTSDGDCC
jgi:molybdopterin molybdotransferase